MISTAHKGRKLEKLVAHKIDAWLNPGSGRFGGAKADVENKHWFVECKYRGYQDADSHDHMILEHDWFKKLLQDSKPSGKRPALAVQTQSGQVLVFVLDEHLDPFVQIHATFWMTTLIQRGDEWGTRTIYLGENHKNHVLVEEIEAGGMLWRALLLDDFSYYNSML